MVTVENLKILNKLKNRRDGEVIYVRKEKKAYMWKEDTQEFLEFDKDLISKGGLKMNLYELNKSIVAQQDPLTDAELNDFKEMLNSVLTKDYYLMYGKEISYFTLFEKEEGSEENIGEAVLSCLEAFEKIYSFEKLEDGTIEIWVNGENDLATVLYLFDYTEGVVTFHG